VPDRPIRRVASLVPSWTETLLEAGAPVVARTRFCLHPAERVAALPVLGGTKQADLERLPELGAELLVLDREENPRAFAEESPVPVVATHVRDVADLPGELRRLRQATGAAALDDMAQRWEAVVTAPPAPLPEAPDRLPGLVEWVTPPARPLADHAHVHYLIWRGPWMRIAPGTFIASMLERVGLGDRLAPAATPYPELAADELAAPDTLLLAATEPFPFHRPRWRAELASLGVPVALVDGERYGWFGLRALRFLEDALAVAP